MKVLPIRPQAVSAIDPAAIITALEQVKLHCLTQHRGTGRALFGSQPIEPLDIVVVEVGQNTRHAVLISTSDITCNPLGYTAFEACPLGDVTHQITAAGLRLTNAAQGAV